MVTPRFRPYIGGVEFHVESLATELARLGHRVTVVTARTDKDSAAHDSVLGVDVVRLRSISPTAHHPVAPDLARVLRQLRPRHDVLHTHHYHSLAAAQASFSRLGLPICFTPHYHGTGHTRVTRALHGPYRPIGRRIFASATAVVCVSLSEAQLVERDFPETHDRITVIPNGVAAAEFLNAEPFELAGRQLVCVGRLEPYKNVSVAIRALRELPSDFELTVVGEGSAMSALVALAVEIGVAPRVRFVGRVDDHTVRRWTRTATAFLALSSAEAFGMSANEARAAGVPIVASEIPAHRELLGSAGSFVDLKSATIAQDVAAKVMTGCVPTVAYEAPADWQDVTQRTSELYERLNGSGGAR